MEKRRRASLSCETGVVVPLPKVPSAVTGLDEILAGGFPEGRMTLICGGPGTGKTVLALEFLYRSALADEPGILLLFEERAAAVRRNALSLGWDLAPLEEAGKLFILEARIDRAAVLSGDFSIAPVLAIVQGQAKALGARRIVIDAIDVLLRVFNDSRREQNELYGLHDWLIENGFTTLMTAKESEKQDGGLHYRFLDYMADCVVFLDLRVCGQVTTRRLRVVKYRGSPFATNEYPYLVGHEGNVIMPISTVSLAHMPLGDRITTGNGPLDLLLDGGYRRGSSVLITGASGTGKTTLACTFVQAACSRGEKVLYVSFEESEQALLSTMLSPGIDLRPSLKAGTLMCLTVMPEAMGAEQHLARAFRRIEAFKPEHVVVDAISACRRMGVEQAAFDYLMRLVDLCKRQSITCIMTNQLESIDEQGDFSGIGLSSLIDAILVLKYVSLSSGVVRRLLVLKSRGSKHSNRYHKYSITDRGIQVTTLAGEAAAQAAMTGRDSSKPVRGKGKTDNR